MRLHPLTAETAQSAFASFTAGVLGAVATPADRASDLQRSRPMTSHHFPMLQDEAWRLIAAIAAVLIVASVIGQVLKYTLARHGAHAAIDNLNHRINAWWAIAILVGLALLAGRAGVTRCCLPLASLAALREFVPREGRGRNAGHGSCAAASLWSCRCSTCWSGAATPCSTASSFQPACCWCCRCSACCLVVRIPS
jgi:hypothetical protein